MTLPRSLDQSAYRIIQEALTNTLRHARGAMAHVAVRYQSDQLELEVTNDQRDNRGPQNHSGEAEGSSGCENESPCSVGTSTLARDQKVVS
jgi:signal transduction histidine kinase